MKKFVSFFSVRFRPFLVLFSFVLFLFCWDLVAFGQTSNLGIDKFQNVVKSKVSEMYLFVKWIVRIIAAIAMLWVSVKIISVLLSNNRSEEGEASKPVVRYVVMAVGIIVVVILSEVIADILKA